MYHREMLLNDLTLSEMIRMRRETFQFYPLVSLVNEIVWIMNRVSHLTPLLTMILVVYHFYERELTDDYSCHEYS